MITLSDTVESVTRRNYPRIRDRPLEILPEVLEDSWIIRSHSGEIIEGLVNTGRKTGRSNIVSQNPAVDYLGEKRRLRDQFAQKIRDILLALRHERFFVACSSAERDNNGFGGSWQRGGSKRRISKQTAESSARYRPQNVTPIP